MEGNFLTSAYNRKCGIVVKNNKVDFYWDHPVFIIDSIRKKNQPVCTYYRNLRVCGCQAPLAPTLTQTLLTLKRQCWHKNTLYWKVRVYIRAGGTEKTLENRPTRFWQKEKQNLLNKKTFYLCPLHFLPIFRPSYGPVI